MESGVVDGFSRFLRQYLALKRATMAQNRGDL